MEQLGHFLLNHWILSAAFVVIILLLLILELLNQLKGIRQISTQEATSAINHKAALVLDVRPAERFKQGHIIDALNIPAAEIDKQQHKLKDHLTKPIIVVCDTGQNSGTIAALLKKQGFTDITCLKGGLTAWREDQLPLVKKK